MTGASAFLGSDRTAKIFSPNIQPQASASRFSKNAGNKAETLFRSEVLVVLVALFSTGSSADSSSLACAHLGRKKIILVLAFGFASTGFEVRVRLLLFFGQPQPFFLFT